MKSANATELHRKSGGAKPRDLLFSYPASTLNESAAPDLSSRAKPRDLQCAPDGSSKLRVPTHAL
jgi:hypothetical protein